MTLKTRQIGLGIMGFADMCIKLHIRYGSEASVDLAKEIMTFIYDVANETSIGLGKEKGVAPVYEEYELSVPKTTKRHADNRCPHRYAILDCQLLIRV